MHDTDPDVRPGAPPVQNLAVNPKAVAGFGSPGRIRKGLVGREWPTATPEFYWGQGKGVKRPLLRWCRSEWDRGVPLMRVHDALSPLPDKNLGDVDAMFAIMEIQDQIFSFFMDRHSLANDLEAEKPLKAIALYEQSAFDEWPGKTSYRRIPILRRKTGTVAEGIKSLEQLLVDCWDKSAKEQLILALENLRSGRQ